MTFKETKMASIVLDDEETKETPSEDAPSTEGYSKEETTSTDLQERDRDTPAEDAPSTEGDSEEKKDESN